MVGRVRRLPIETQKVLQQLACFGNSAQTAFLSMVHESSEEKLHADLWEAQRSELVVRTGTSYKFMHARIQEAAYLLIPMKERAATHLRIGRLLTAHLSSDKREE